MFFFLFFFLIWRFLYNDEPFEKAFFHEFCSTTSASASGRFLEKWNKDVCSFSNIRFWYDTDKKRWIWLAGMLMLRHMFDRLTHWACLITWWQKTLGQSLCGYPGCRLVGAGGVISVIWDFLKSTDKTFCLWSCFRIIRFFNMEAINWELI